MLYDIIYMPVCVYMGVWQHMLIQITKIYMICKSFLFLNISMKNMETEKGYFQTTIRKHHVTLILVLKLMQLY